MNLFRRLIFWTHLVCGLVAGLVIGIMSFTGAALAFEKETIAFAERDARRVTPPAPDAQPLSLDELTQRIRAARPEYRPAGFVISNDPHAAISLSAGGRGGGPGGGAAPSLYANPYTGEVREASSPRTSAFLRTMRSWHRWLGVEGEHRNIARAVTGACNFAFLGLGITGLYLWWPRSWSWRSVRAIAWFKNVSGKARDFNWHNVIGLWSAPVLIVLTATALPMSYQWAGTLIYKMTGTPAPAMGGGPGGGGQFGGGPAVEVPTPPAGAKPLSYDALVAAVQKEYPTWDTITLRVAGGAGGLGGRGSGGSQGGEGAGRGGRGGEGGGAAPASAPRAEAPAGASRSSDTPSLARAAAAAASPAPAAIAVRPAVAVTLKRSDTWPRTTTTTLSLDPYTGAILRRTGYADQNAAQQVRSWTRFLHTGEALGWLGQLVAGFASLGGCVLMYTGFALSWRRFFGRKAATTAA